MANVLMPDGESNPNVKLPRSDRLLVVSHFKENLGWLRNVKIPYLVYSKGPDRPLKSVELPNFGREAHTYLHHIVQSYPVFPDLTFFCQGWPFDHSPDFIERLTLPYFDTTSLTGMYRAGYHDHLKWAQREQSHFGYNTTLFKCDNYGRPYAQFKTSIPGFRSIPWLWFELFDTKMPPKVGIYWFHSAQFVVPRARILGRSLAFYRHALGLVHHPNFFHRKAKANHRNNGPWVFERLWFYIFGDSKIWQSKAHLL